MTEGKATGSIKWSTVIMYLRSMGSWHYWVLAVSVFCMQQLGSVSTNIWIRQWANSYTEHNAVLVVQSPATSYPPGLQHNSTPSQKDLPLSGALAMLTGRFMWFMPTGDTSSAEQWTVSRVASATSASPDVGYYLGIYIALGVLYIFISWEGELGQQKPHRLSSICTLLGRIHFLSVSLHAKRQ